MSCLHKITTGNPYNYIQFEKAAEDLKALENLIQGQREFEDLKKMYEEAREAARTDESLLYKKMFKKSENSINILILRWRDKCY